MSKWSESSPARNVLGRYVKADELHRLADSRTPLVIVAVVPDDANRYGPRWLVSVVDLMSGLVLALGFKRNDVRDGSMRWAAAQLYSAVTDGDFARAIDPIILVQVPTKAGQIAWTFADAGESDLAGIGDIVAIVETALDAERARSADVAPVDDDEPDVETATRPRLRKAAASA